MYRRANLFYRVLDALFRNQKLVILTLICVALPVSLLLLTKSKGYSAMGAIRVVPEASTVRGTVGGNPEANYGWKTAADWHADALRSLLRDTKEGGFVDTVFQNAAITPKVSFAPKSADRRVDQFLAGLVVVKDQDNVFTVTLNWPDPEEGKRLVTALREHFIAEQLRDKQLASHSAVEFLAREVNTVQKRVDSAAQAVQRYQQLHPDVGPDQQAQTADHVTFLKDRLLRAKATLASANRRSGDLSPKLRKTNPYLEPDVVEDGNGLVPGMSLAQKRIIELLEQRTQLTTGDGAYLESNETIRILDAQIERLRLDVAKEGTSVTTKRSGKKKLPNPTFQKLMDDISDTAALAQGTANEIKELLVLIAEEEKKLGTIPAITRQAETLKAELQGQQAYLVKLRDSYNEAVRKENIEREQASLVLQPLGDVFVANLTGVKKKMLLGLVSIVIGMIVAGLMVAVREWSDPTVRYESDIESLFDVPVLTGLRETPVVLSHKMIGTKVGNEGKDTSS